MSWIGLAIGAGVGIIKAEAVDAPKAAKQRTLAAATQRYAPWTGLTAQPVQEADPLGSAMQYGATGAAMGQGIQNAGAQGNLVDAQTRLLNAKAGSYTVPQIGQTGLTAPTLGNPSGANPWQFTDWT